MGSDNPYGVAPGQVWGNPALKPVRRVVTILKVIDKSVFVQTNRGLIKEMPLSLFRTGFRGYKKVIGQ